MPGLIELLKILERTRVSGFQANLLPRKRIHAVIQGNLQYLRCIEISRKKIGLLAECAHLYAAGAAAFTGILKGFPLPHQLFHVSIRVEHGRISVSLADNLYAFNKEVVGGVFRDMYGKTGLKLVELFLDFQYHVGKLVDAGIAVTVHSAYVDIGKVVIST